MPDNFQPAADSLKQLKNRVFLANKELVQHGLVVLTWGNASALSDDRTQVVIKPSGIDYDGMTADDMVVVDLDGNVLDGKWKASSDTPTHLYLYRHFPNIGGIVHTHSRWATMFAQARREIRCFGTTHADHFHGPVPLTRALTRSEVETDYEKNTGAVIIERFTDVSQRFPIPNHVAKPISPDEFPGVLVAGHGPLTWGPDVEAAVKNAVALEDIAQIAFGTQMLVLEQNCLYNEDLNFRGTPQLEDYVLHKHYDRKHGNNAYYGQREKADGGT